MIGSTSGSEVVRFKVEEVLKEMMHVEARLSKDDWRIRAIHAELGRLYDEEQRNSCISDEELRAYVQKYFFFKSILEKETHRIDENGQVHESEAALKNASLTEKSSA
jgi:hypothetical protein